jgi:hypothetical protein
MVPSIQTEATSMDSKVKPMKQVEVRIRMIVIAPVMRAQKKKKMRAAMKSKVTTFYLLT